MSKNLTITLIFALAFVLSCKKDKVACSDCPQTANYCEDVQNLKSYFAFKIGSWWIYEEENSGKRDTISIIQYVNNPNTAAFDLIAYSTYQSYNYHYWVEWASTNSQCSDSGIICYKCLNVVKSKYKPGDFVDEATCFFFIPKIYDFAYNWNYVVPNNKVILEEVYETYSIDTLFFGKTYRMFEMSTVMEDYQPTNHYYSKDVGLVRKELLDSNEVWNLINYYIQE